MTIIQHAFSFSITWTGTFTSGSFLVFGAFIAITKNKTHCSTNNNTICPEASIMVKQGLIKINLI